MNQVQVEQKTYEMPPQEGFTVAYFSSHRRRHPERSGSIFTKRSSEVAF